MRKAEVSGERKSQPHTAGLILQTLISTLFLIIIPIKLYYSRRLADSDIYGKRSRQNFKEFNMQTYANGL